VSWCSSLDLAAESARLVQKILQGSVIRLQMVEARDFVLEIHEFALEIGAVCAEKPLPNAETDILGSAGRLEKPPDLGRGEVRSPGDGANGCCVCVMVAPGMVEQASGDVAGTLHG
jgi:hypothetical protein